MPSFRALLLLISLLLPPSTCLTPDERTSLKSHLLQTSASNLLRLQTFLRIPSISALPSHNPAVRKAATWLADDLHKSGLEHVQLLETPLHPAVYADWLHAPDKPTVLIYGHYDVQPVDPEHLWTHAPFDPVVKEGRLYCRGASDDKGHMYVPVVALRAYLEVLGKLPVNVKLLFEGEEEIGSPNLKRLLEDNARLLRADFSLSADGGQVSPSIPGICLGLRGSVALEVHVRVADVDLHSGQYGGGVQNPVHALAAILASLRDMRSGSVSVDGFYEDVRDIGDDLRADIRKFPRVQTDMLKGVGINESVGESGLSFLERTWARPSLEIVGITGGFQGDGLKTVLPREASAKLSARIVANQKVDKVYKALHTHITKTASHIPGIQLSITQFPFLADAYTMDKHTSCNQAASKILREVYGREPVFFNMGGSIPVMSHLQNILGLDTTMFAFGHDDENIHAPDEFARLDSYERGRWAYVRMLEELGERVGAKEEL